MSIAARSMPGKFAVFYATYGGAGMFLPFTHALGVDALQIPFEFFEITRLQEFNEVSNEFVSISGLHRPFF